MYYSDDLYLFSDNVQALFNVWFVGDDFLQSVYNTFMDVKDQATRDKGYPKPYMLENYNVIGFYKPTEGGNVSSAMA